MKIRSGYECEKEDARCAKCGRRLQHIWIDSKSGYGDTIPCASCWDIKQGPMMIVPFMRELPLWGRSVPPETSAFVDVRFQWMPPIPEAKVSAVWSQLVDL